MNTRQVVFIGDGGRYYPGNPVLEHIEVKRLRGLGFELPRGMFAYYTVTRLTDGRVEVGGVLQARTKYGSRRFTDSNESAAQERLLKWSARILRERAKEIA